LWHRKDDQRDAAHIVHPAEVAEKILDESIGDLLGRKVLKKGCPLLPIAGDEDGRRLDRLRAEQDCGVGTGLRHRDGLLTRRLVGSLSVLKRANGRRGVVETVSEVLLATEGEIFESLCGLLGLFIGRIGSDGALDDGHHAGHSRQRQREVGHGGRRFGLVGLAHARAHGLRCRRAKVAFAAF
jgi:hypothetical protein